MDYIEGYAKLFMLCKHVHVSESHADEFDRFLAAHGCSFSRDGNHFYLMETAVA